jgi:hypothetical protein
LLIELLAADYPLDHEVIVYEAATLPIGDARMERMTLSAVVDAELSQQSTLVLPPSREMAPNQAMLARIAALQQLTDDC